MARLKPEERKKRILDAARNLFLSKGYEAVKVEDILSAERISKGGFYHHFKSKEDILRGLVREEVEDLESITAEEKGPLDQLIALFRQGSSYLGADLGIRSALVSFSSRSIYLDELEKQFERILQPYLVSIFRVGITEGCFNEHDPETTSELFLAVNNYGNRKMILSRWSSEKAEAYNQTAFGVLGQYLGIQEEINEINRSK